LFSSRPLHLSLSQLKLPQLLLALRSSPWCPPDTLLLRHLPRLQLQLRP
jgi:hypothetical protein